MMTEAVKAGRLVEKGRYLQSLAAKGSWGGWIKGLGAQAVQSLGDR